MGYYREEPEEQPPGCMEALALTRGMLAIIGVFLGALIVLVADIVATFVLFSVHPALALLTIVPTIAAVWWYARWERRRFRPPGL